MQNKQTENVKCLHAYWYFFVRLGCFLDVFREYSLATHREQTWALVDGCVCLAAMQLCSLRSSIPEKYSHRKAGLFLSSDLNHLNKQGGKNYGKKEVRPRQDIAHLDPQAGRHPRLHGGAQDFCSHAPPLSSPWYMSSEMFARETAQLWWPWQLSLPQAPSFLSAATCMVEVWLRHVCILARLL